LECLVKRHDIDSLYIEIDLTFLHIKFGCVRYLNQCEGRNGRSGNEDPNISCVRTSWSFKASLPRLYCRLQITSFISKI
jgi:hypothetical protein